MSKFFAIFSFLCLTLFSKLSYADKTCDSGSVCVAPEDLKVLIQLAKDHKCRNDSPPVVTLDPITITIDKEGRVYGTGSDPVPYRVHMDWCNYKIEGTGTVKLDAAQTVPNEWGFRFRPKFGSGLLIIDAVTKSKWTDGVEVAVLADVFFHRNLNFNLALGLRSAGILVGLDLTKNFGAYLGYGLTWGTWASNPSTGLYFSF